MPTRIYLVRHGATDLTADDRFAGSSDVPLSDTGRRQVASLAERLRGEDLDAIYASPLQRTVETARILATQYGGEVPASIEELQKLPGVGKKTANVVASNAFGIPAIAVDTHVFRVSNRIGLANAKNVEKTEEQLQKAIPREDWTAAHHWLIYHGRQICDARKPKCEICPLSHLCLYYQGGKQAAKKPAAKKPNSTKTNKKD